MPTYSIRLTDEDARRLGELVEHYGAIWPERDWTRSSVIRSLIRSAHRCSDTPKGKP